MMENVTTPQKLSFKTVANIHTVCICCKESVVEKVTIQKRRLANCFKDTIISLDPDYVLFFEQGSPVNLFVCKSCTNRLNKITSIRRRIDDLNGELNQHKVQFHQQSVNFKNSYLQLKRGSKASPSKRVSKHARTSDSSALSENDKASNKGLCFRQLFQSEKKPMTAKENIPYEQSPTETIITSPQFSCMPTKYIATPKHPSFKEINFVAKVECRFGSKTRTKYLEENDPDILIVRGMQDNRDRGCRQIVQVVTSTEKYRKLIVEYIMKELSGECKSLCSFTCPSILQDVKSVALEELDMMNILKEWRERAPMLHAVLSSIAGKSDSMSVAVAGSMLLHQRHSKMAAVQHSLGLMLDFAGTRDKALAALSHCSIVTATQTINRKKKEIELQRKSEIKETVLKRKLMIEEQAISECMDTPIQLFNLNKGNIELMKWMLSIMQNIDTTRDGQNMSDCSETYPTQWDIYGDNLDFNRGIFHRTLDKQNQSLHWFLLVGAPLRVIPDRNLARTRPRRDIIQVDNQEFIPSLAENKALKDNFEFHITEVLVKFVPFLEKYRNAVPKYIDHDNVANMIPKHPYFILDLLEKNESKHDDMIDILQEVHTYIAGLDVVYGQNVLDRMVFGGDVLTNERAYSAQMDMLNGVNESDRLQGIMHRPEGLHLCMNYCHYIMSTYYSPSSAADQGTLYNLAVKTRKTADISMDMTKSYNPCRMLIDDCLDSHIVALAMTVFGIKNISDSPKKYKPSILLETASLERQYQYLCDIANEVVAILYRRATRDIASEVHECDTNARALRNIDANGKFCCPFGGCEKQYGSEGWLRRHLSRQHCVNIQRTAGESNEEEDQHDGKFNYAMSFTKAALLLRDTRDAFKMGDGSRVFRNIKFLMLHFDRGHHIKYRLWMFRMLSYDLALLSEFERSVYRNNIAINLVGGVRQCIANDNLVEIHVHKVKECMRAMGANMTFPAVRRAAMCINTVNKITESLSIKRSGTHTNANTERDIAVMTQTLTEQQIMTHIPHREHATFPNFPFDLLNQVKVSEFNSWLTKQKDRANREMITEIL